MIPQGVQVFVALEAIDMRLFAEHVVMRSWVAPDASPHSGRSQQAEDDLNVFVLA